MRSDLSRLESVLYLQYLINNNYSLDTTNKYIPSYSLGCPGINYDNAVDDAYVYLYYFKYSDRRGALMREACERGLFPLIEALSNMDNLDKQYCIALSYATGNAGTIRQVEQILDTNGDQYSDYKHMFALVSGNYELAVSARSYIGSDSLIYAIKSNDLDTVRKVVRSKPEYTGEVYNILQYASNEVVRYVRIAYGPYIFTNTELIYEHSMSIGDVDMVKRLYADTKTKPKSLDAVQTLPVLYTLVYDMEVTDFSLFLFLLAPAEVLHALSEVVNLEDSLHLPPNIYEARPEVVHYLSHRVPGFYDYILPTLKPSEVTFVNTGTLECNVSVIPSNYF